MQGSRRLAPWLILGLAVAAAGLLFARQRRLPVPLPPSLSFVLENPVTEAFVGTERILERAGLGPGLRVLDAGCGPGRIAAPAARRVRPGGEVVALDSQEEMLRRLEEHLEPAGIENVRPVKGELGTGELLTSGAFDRVLLVMVLGEIRNRERALEELYRAMKAGGVLSVTEALGDPDYHGRETVRREAEAAGFQLAHLYDGWISYTMNFIKPAG